MALISLLTFYCLLGLALSQSTYIAIDCTEQKSNFTYCKDQYSSDLTDYVKLGCYYVNQTNCSNNTITEVGYFCLPAELAKSQFYLAGQETAYIINHRQNQTDESYVRSDRCTYSDSQYNYICLSKSPGAQYTCCSNYTVAVNGVVATQIGNYQSPSCITGSGCWTFTLGNESGTQFTLFRKCIN